jgi:hypothetical protein
MKEFVADGFSNSSESHGNGEITARWRHGMGILA